MPIVRAVQTSLTSGELDPRLRKRTDVKHYYNGAAKIYNCLVHPQGGAFSRWGLRYNLTLPEKVRFHGFKFNESQSYLLAFGNNTLRVYMNGVLQATIATPYTSDQLPYLRFAQSFDYLIIFHQSVQTRSLVRGGSHTSWTMSTVTWDYIPKYGWSTTRTNPATTVTPSAKSGNISLTAGSGVFMSTDVGGYVTGNGGEARVTKYVSATVVLATVTVAFVDTSAITSGNWEIERGYEDAWSATRGWPRCGTFHRGRLIVAGTTQLPTTWWASGVNDYFNFDLGSALDDDAIDYPIQDNEVNTITDVVSAGHLQLFTTGGPFYVPESDSAALTPSNVKCYKQDNKPIGNVAPLFVDGATVWYQKDTSLMREFLWSELDQKYNSGNLTLLSSHLINDPVQMSYEPPKGDRDSDLVYVVNGDGTWAVFNSLRAQEISAWVGHGTQNGKIISVYTDNGVTYAEIERTVNGSTVYYMEQFVESLLVDCSKQVTSATNTTTWTGLSHLEGETVHVFVDGYYDGERTVSGGTITTDTAGKVMEAGYDISPKVKLLPPEKELADGTLVGRKKRIFNVNVELNDTTGLTVNGKTVKFRKFGDNLFDEPLQPYTGSKSLSLLGYNKDPDLEFGTPYPSKFHIVSVVQKVKVS